MRKTFPCEQSPTGAPGQPVLICIDPAAGTRTLARASLFPLRDYHTSIRVSLRVRVCAGVVAATGDSCSWSPTEVKGGLARTDRITTEAKQTSDQRAGKR
jgi:hypothetical protein